MSAIERIRKIEEFHNIDIEEKKFLLKAFKVMQTIAIEYKQAAGCARGMTGDFDVDKEFELTMSQNEERMKDE